MSDSHTIGNDFLTKASEIIEENISDEQFGVSELAQAMNMSRSNLLRKTKKLTKLSVSQFIRQIRLQHAMELMKQQSYTVSEVSFKVGFSSTSYFIKCFREYYGHPPGEIGKTDFQESDPIQSGPTKKRKVVVLIGAIFIIALFAFLLFVVVKPFSGKPHMLEKSIAVLPFINDSDDSSNVHIINGLMESILNNLQQIEDLRVISRTSVEKYRNNPKLISEIARELNVNYFVEGSGQKIGDQILLNVQLIEAPTDKHLWAAQYSREAKDIFALQMEVAKRIAGEIEAIITPEEEARINKVPTEDLVAYDYFLKGLDSFYTWTPEGFEEAIFLFKKAIEHDHEFARAYADVAISYSLLDASQAEKKYSDQINYYADQALLFDPQLPQSLIAKALFYMYSKEYELALPYLEKALEYNPNSALVINILSDFYATKHPNTEKYLEYALKGIQLDIATHDSITASFIYLHISNAFIQTGFIEQAEKYINKSLEYDPENLFSEYVKAYILYARNRDLGQLKELLVETLQKDSTRLDVLQEVGKACYYLRDYDCAYQYYGKFIAIKEAYNLNIYQGENAKIGVVLSNVGLPEKSEEYCNNYKGYAENDHSIYKHLNLAVYYSYQGDTTRALEQLKLFSKQDNYHYWIILFLEIDPLVDNIKDLPEFKKILQDIETKFWKSHKQIKASLKEKEFL
ncbi:MAG: helix-turn-helix domain-containing protein [Bacteroidia bacterium]|nr:helix-turn-helix domain-containing protein [Bacteroidia bacterium]